MIQPGSGWLRTVVFDLDDTLYPELTYVISGFRTVASALAAVYGVNAREAETEMVAALTRGGRGSVFDVVLARHGLLNAKRVRQCVALYRRHEPRITLFPDAVECLRRFTHLPCYVVTDGHKAVQARKVAALGVERMVKKVYITHQFGRTRAKPSPYCFARICEREGVSPENVLFVGDDPTKDFVGIRELGFRTVRIRRGRLSGMTLDSAHEAEYAVESLSQLDSELLRRLGSRRGKRDRQRTTRT